MRKELDVIAYGDVQPLAQKDPSVFAYRRTCEGHELIVAANFYGRDYEWKGAPKLEGFERVLGNYAETEVKENGEIALKPYETAVWYR